GRRLASAGLEGRIKVWDADPRPNPRTLAGLNGPVCDLAFSPDGRILATSDNSRTIRLSDATTGAEVRTLSGHNWALAAIAFSPDGRLVASAGGVSRFIPSRNLSEDGLGEIILWDARTGRRLHTIHAHARGANRLAFRPDGRRLASCGYPGMMIWDVESGRRVA